MQESSDLFGFILYHHRPHWRSGHSLAPPEHEGGKNPENTLHIHNKHTKRTETVTGAFHRFFSTGDFKALKHQGLSADDLFRSGRSLQRVAHSRSRYFIENLEAKRVLCSKPPDPQTQGRST